MNKRITIKDIARESGVSTATVSYVINNRTDQYISEETKNKVWQVINLFNYQPSAMAKSLRSSTIVKYVAVYFNDSNEILYQAEILRFCKILSKRFEESNFELVIPCCDYKKLDTVDAILSINNSKEDFHKIGIVNYIPLIAVDTTIDDNIFFSVTTDCEKLKEAADNVFDSDYSFVLLKPNDDQIREDITKTFNNVIFVENISDLNNIEANKLFVIDKTINDYIVNNYPSKKIYYYRDYAHRKCDVIVCCLKQALSHEKFDQHRFKV